MSRCSEGHTGLLCEDCLEDNFYFNVESAHCETCPTGSTAALLVIAFLLGCTLVVVIFNILLLRKPTLRRLWRRFKAYFDTLGIVAKTKCVVSFFQVFAAVPSGYAVNVPDEYSQLTNWLSVLTLDLDLLNVYPSR